jgi:hypothetical protein
MSLVLAACLGSLLYLVEMMVRAGRVSWEDFGAASASTCGTSSPCGARVLRVDVEPLAQLPQGHVIILCVVLVSFVLFNAVPELIYLGHYNLAALLARSYEFVANNWIEWFPPNLLLAVTLGAIWLYPTETPAGWIVQRVLGSLFFYFTMVVRGLLFIELDGSTRRSRIFRHKMGR